MNTLLLFFFTYQTSMVKQDAPLTETTSQQSISTVLPSPFVTRVNEWSDSWTKTRTVQMFDLLTFDVWRLSADGGGITTPQVLDLMKVDRVIPARIADTPLMPHSFIKTHLSSAEGVVSGEEIMIVGDRSDGLKDSSVGIMPTSAHLLHVTCCWADQDRRWDSGTGFLITKSAIRLVQPSITKTASVPTDTRCGLSSYQLTYITPSISRIPTLGALKTSDNMGHLLGVILEIDSALIWYHGMIQCPWFNTSRAHI